MAGASGFVENWQNGKSLPECNLHMLTSEVSSDVIFRVGKTEAVVRAHRYVLISRSCVFSAMLCGPLAEKDEIAIKDVETGDFQDFLKYLYSETAVLNPDNATTMLYLSKKYAVGGLESQSVAFLETCLSADNACLILEQAHSFDEKNLYNKSLSVIRSSATTVLSTSGFRDLCSDCFHAVIKSPEIIKLPVEVFKAAQTWSVAECSRKGLKATPENKRKVLGLNLHHIYFADMEKTFFVKTVVPSQILTNDETVRILSYFVCPDVNIAPFKTLHPVKKKVKVEKPIETFELNLYTNNVRAEETRDRKYVCDTFCLSCSDSVLLRGLHMYGSGRQHILCHKYHIKVFHRKHSCFANLVFDFEVSLDSSSNSFGVSSARLVAPLPLEKNASYEFQVRMIAGDLPLYTGSIQTTTSEVTSGKYTLSAKPGLSKVKFVAGFVFSEPCKETVKMTSVTKYC